MNRKGFMLIVALLVMGILFLAGAGFLASQTSLRQSAYEGVKLAQARGLAESGVEDARMKLARDPLFPPIGTTSQLEFSYSEEVVDLAGDPVGRYYVTVDVTRRGYPYHLVTIRSVGLVGPASDPIATYGLSCELDIFQRDRADPLNAASTNNNLFTTTLVREEIKP